MRWRLGRSAGNPFSSKKKKRATANNTPPVDVVATPPNRSSSATSITVAAGARHYQLDRSSELEATVAVENDGDSIYCATASSLLRSRGRAANGELVRTRPGLDGLSSSVLSFVEDLGSQPRLQPSPAEAAAFPWSSTSTNYTRGKGSDQGNSRARFSTAGAENDALSSTVDGTQTTATSTTVATAVTAPSLSSSSIQRATVTEEEYLLRAEIQVHILRRGVLIDHGAALGAARVCLTLIFSREPTPEAMQQTGPTELVSLARSNLSLGAGAAACLLTQLVDNETTAATLAATGTEFRDSRQGLPSGGAGVTRNGVAVGAFEKKPPAVCLRHEPGLKTATTIVSGAKTVAASSLVETMETAVAATVLSEACRAWGDTIEALRATTETVAEKYRNSAVPSSGSTTTEAAVSDDANKATGKYCPDDSSPCCSLDSPRSHYRPRRGREFSTASTVTATERAGNRRQDTQHIVR